MNIKKHITFLAAATLLAIPLAAAAQDGRTVWSGVASTCTPASTNNSALKKLNMDQSETVATSPYQRTVLEEGGRVGFNSGRTGAQRWRCNVSLPSETEILTLGLTYIDEDGGFSDDIVYAILREIDNDTGVERDVLVISSGDFDTPLDSSVQHQFKSLSTNSCGALTIQEGFSYYVEFIVKAGKGNPRAISAQLLEPTSGCIR